MHRRPYPSDVSDEEWEFVAPYLSLLPQTAAQRRHDLREVFNAVRSIVRTGAPWRWLPTNFPPWEAVYQQTRRWIAAGCFEAIVHDLRLLVRAAAGRRPQPSAALVDSRTLRSRVESGQRAGVDGHKRVRGSKVHAVVDTLGTRLALAVTPANEAERRQISALAQRVQEVTGETVEVIYADAAYTGEETAAAAQEQGMRLVVVQRPEGSHGFVLLPKRWVVERSFAWVSRFRRLARDYERLPATLAGLHFAAFICLLLPKLLRLIGGSKQARCRCASAEGMKMGASREILLVGPACRRSSKRRRPRARKTS
jgi:transposase